MVLAQVTLIPCLSITRVAQASILVQRALFQESRPIITPLPTLAQMDQIRMRSLHCHTLILINRIGTTLAPLEPTMILIVVPFLEPLSTVAQADKVGQEVKPSL